MTVEIFLGAIALAALFAFVLSRRRFGIVAALLALALAACDGGAGDAPRPAASPAGLEIGPIIKGKTRSPGYPTHLARQGEGWAVTLYPDAELSAVIDHDFRIPPDATKLIWHYRASIEHAAPTEYPDRAPTITIMLQRRGDDWTAQGEKEFFRLYSPAFPLETGEHVRVIPLEGWTGVFGKGGPEHMAAVRADLANVSVGFGSAGGRMHGVSGAGTFETISLRAE